MKGDPTVLFVWKSSEIQVLESFFCKSKSGEMDCLTESAEKKQLVTTRYMELIKDCCYKELLATHGILGTEKHWSHNQVMQDYCYKLEKLVRCTLESDK
jgi:hypothetical protein